jgi:hypothetical protein
MGAMRRMGLKIVLFFALWAPGAAAADSAPLFGPPPSPPYIAPGRLFSVTLPPGWTPKTFADKPDLVELRITGRPGNAWLQVQRLPVAEGARARQLLVRAVDARLKKLPHFTEVQRRDVDFNGLKGAGLVGTFWYQGNAQYPRAFEEIYLVLGNEAFELHFECFEPLSQSLAYDLNRVYSSFVPRPPVSTPQVNPGDDDEDPLDKIPF